MLLLTAAALVFFSFIRKMLMAGVLLSAKLVKIIFKHLRC